MPKNIWEEYDENFESIYYGKDIEGFPNYPPENFKEDVKTFIRQKFKEAFDEIEKQGVKAEGAIMIAEKYFYEIKEKY